MKGHYKSIICGLESMGVDRNFPNTSGKFLSALFVRVGNQILQRSVSGNER
jgi:hypothetical protein